MQKFTIDLLLALDNVGMIGFEAELASQGDSLKQINCYHPFCKLTYIIEYYNGVICSRVNFIEEGDDVSTYDVISIHRNVNEVVINTIKVIQDHILNLIQKNPVLRFSYQHCHFYNPATNEIYKFLDEIII